MAPHVKSKRQTLRHKYKVAKKVRQHHREVRRANRKKPEVRKIKRKDPGIPNLWPYKQQMLEAIERKKAQDAEAKKEMQAARREAFRKAREAGVDAPLAQVMADAKVRERNFEGRQATATTGGSNNDDEEELNNGVSPADSSKRAFMKEFKKVLESSDVVLEVLDARDPMGCRCYEAERAIVAASGGTKRIVLVLNKVDMVPKEVAAKWLAYLRNDFPTVAFRASVQEGRGKGQANVSAMAATSINTSECLGASNLLSLLKNYSRSKNLKTTIAVGVIGYPNVGKSSLINSLKRCRAVNAGASPGVTRSAQEVHLDKNIRLIDCPGIVFSAKQADALVLRNCIKIENLYDPISPVDTIIKRVGHEPLMIAYGLPAFKDTTEFLACVCSARGKIKSGGVFNMEEAARLVLKDWNSGSIPFYTLPPKGPSKAHLGASVMQEWGKEFDINSVADKEQNQLDSLKMPGTVKARFAEAEASMVDDEEKGGDDDNENDSGDAMTDDDEDDDEANKPEQNSNEDEPSYHVAELSSGSSSLVQKRKS